MKTLVLLALVGFVAAQIQVLIPIRRPQQPQQPPQRQPISPRTWRKGTPDSRCPVPDDHEGDGFFLPGDVPTEFFKCWGGVAWPFVCPGSTVFDSARNVCVFPSQLSGRVGFRPFNEDGEDNE